MVFLKVAIKWEKLSNYILIYGVTGLKFMLIMANVAPRYGNLSSYQRMDKHFYINSPSNADQEFTYGTPFSIQLRKHIGDKL